MAGQRARPAISADHRSAHPNLPGVPWWGAVLIAVVASLIGFAVDASSGSGELTGIFSALFALGCLAAVLAVRQSGLFTAVIQPPLILFVMVPGAYYLMHSAEIEGVRDILINCGYPLIERFPLMFFTAATVLLLGAARWYFGASTRRGAPASEETSATGGGLVSKLSSLLGGDAGADSADQDTRRRRPTDRRPNRAAESRSDRAARGARPAKRAGGPSRSRHARPPDTEIIEPVMDEDRPRRRRPRPAETPPAPAAEPRRRAREAPGRERRGGSVPSGERRAAYDRGERRERERPQRPQRPQRPSRYDDYNPFEDPFERYEPPRRSETPSHHPVSRVRYRGDDPDDRTEHRPRRRAPRDYDADRWKYDI